MFTDKGTIKSSDRGWAQQPSKLKFYEMKKRTQAKKTLILNRKLIFPMFFTLYSLDKDLKSVIAGFPGGGGKARAPLYRSRWGTLPPPVYALGT